MPIRIISLTAMVFLSTALGWMEGSHVQIAVPTEKVAACFVTAWVQVPYMQDPRRVDSPEEADSRLLLLRLIRSLQGYLCNSGWKVYESRSNEERNSSDAVMVPMKSVFIIRHIPIHMDHWTRWKPCSGIQSHTDLFMN